MRNNPGDNSCTDRSPCRGCEINDAGIDKRLCFAKCPALAAYRDHGAWKGVRRLTIPEAMNDEPPAPATDIIKVNLQGPAEPELGPEPCIVNDCDKKKFCRDLCEHCYYQWHYGTIEHPVLGPYRYKAGTKRAKENPTRGSKKERLESSTMSINFTLYPELKKAIVALSQEMLLPVEVVVMNLLSDGLKKQGG